MAKKINSTNYANERLLQERCVLNKVLALIGRRWLAEILLLIESNATRFSQLKLNLHGISDAVLSSNLNSLVKYGLLSKVVYQQVPIKIEYHLSANGKKVLILLHGLCAWGKESLEKNP